MKVVIDVDEEIYNDIKEGFACSEYGDELIKSVKKGTPLPKGHGRIGDLDALETEMSNGIKAGLMIEGYENYPNINNVDDCLECVKYADAIIEAEG